MTDYIKRQDAKDLINANFSGLLAQIDAIPAADVAPVVHAKWVLRTNVGPSEIYCCSMCGRNEVRFGKTSITRQYPFCHCGAKMDGEP